MKILVTNDDGVLSPGLAALASAVADLGVDVLIVAPLEDRSGSGAAIGPLGSLDRFAYEDLSVGGMDAIGIDGPPGLCVLTACLGAFGAAPDVVIAGVNPGTNTGRAVIHSGTVGAALTATTLGCPGVAVSLATGDDMPWSLAARIGASTVEWMLDWRIPTVINVNVPNRANPVGVRAAPLASFGTVRAAARALDGHIQMELRAAPTAFEDDSDIALVEAGYVTVTEVVGALTAGGQGTAQAADHLRGALRPLLASAS